MNNGFAPPSLKVVSATLDLVLLEICEKVFFQKAFFGCKFGFKTQSPQFSRNSVSSVVTVHRVTIAVYWDKSLSNKDMLLIGGLDLSCYGVSQCVCAGGHMGGHTVRAKQKPT